MPVSAVLDDLPGCVELDASSGRFGKGVQAAPPQLKMHCDGMNALDFLL